MSVGIISNVLNAAVQHGKMVHLDALPRIRLILLPSRFLKWVGVATLLDIGQYMLDIIIIAEVDKPIIQRIVINRPSTPKILTNRRMK